MSQKKILFFSDGMLPYYTGNGSAVLMYGIIKCFLELGHSVTVMPLGLSNDKLKNFDNQKKYLEADGITVKVLPEIIKEKPKSRLSILRENLFPRTEDFFYCSDELTYNYVQDYINENKIDIIYGYNWFPLYLMNRIENVKKLISIVDLIDDFEEQKKQNVNKLKGIAKLKGKFKMLNSSFFIKSCYELLSEMDFIFEHAYQHTIELQRKGYNNIIYLPHPLIAKNINFLKKNDVSNDKITVLILGSLKGVASQLGYRFFFDKLLPVLNKKRKQLNKTLNFRLVGHGKPKEFIIEEAAKNENVDFIGFVDNLDEEYKKADLMLVNIPISHGFRTRIAEAFSYGMCLVGHSANAEGMPEIKDGFNAATSSNPEILADKLIELANKADRRFQIGKNAIETFETEISHKAAVPKFKDVLNNLGN